MKLLLQTFLNYPSSSATIDPGAVLSTLTSHNLKLCTSPNIKSDIYYCSETVLQAASPNITFLHF